MPTINASEQLTVRGTLDIASGTLSLRDGQLNRNKLLQQDNEPLGIPVTALRVWDDLASLLPGTAAADDLALIEGTWGTDAPTVQTSDSKATSVTQYARVQIPLDDAYVLGQTMTLRIRAGMITTVSDGTATVDVECYVSDGDGGVGSDLCSTAAQSCNSLTKANLDFTLDGAGLSRGDVLDVRIAIAITDSATGTAVIGEISAIELLRDIKG